MDTQVVIPLHAIRNHLNGHGERAKLTRRELIEDALMARRIGIQVGLNVHALRALARRHPRRYYEIRSVAS